MATPGELYQKFLKCDVLTDAELKALHVHFKALWNLLSVSGPIFALASVEAGRVEMRTFDMMQARKGM